LWLHGISISDCHVHNGKYSGAKKNKPTIFSSFTSDRYGDYLSLW
jgi:hypothetical protein